MPLFKSFRKARRSSLSSSVAPSEAGDLPTSASKTSALSDAVPSLSGKKSSSLRGKNSAARLQRPGSKDASFAAPTLPTIASSPHGDRNSIVQGGNHPSTPPEAATPAGPRPSDLFAGKGVQWDSINLSSPSSVRSGNGTSASGTSEDLQNFLKARRQWVPTFVTEDAEGENRTSAPPSDLSQLTFGSTIPETDASLKSLKDLEESHKRKQKLLGERRLGGSLFEEAETSAAGANKAALAQQKAAAAAAASSATTAAAPPRPSVAARAPSATKEGAGSIPGSIKREPTDYARLAAEQEAAAAVANGSAALPGSGSAPTAGGIGAVGPGAGPGAESATASSIQARSSSIPAAVAAVTSPAASNDAAPATLPATTSATEMDRHANATDNSGAGTAIRESMDDGAGFSTPIAGSERPSLNVAPNDVPATAAAAAAGTAPQTTTTASNKGNGATTSPPASNGGVSALSKKFEAFGNQAKQIREEGSNSNPGLNEAAAGSKTTTTTKADAPAPNNAIPVYPGSNGMTTA